MRFPVFLLLAGLSAPVLPAQTSVTPPAAPAPFFEPLQPFFQTQVDVGASVTLDEPTNFVVRGLVIPLAPDFALVFDQELLRIAGFWRVPLDHPPITLQTMAQISYAVSRRRVYDGHPEPTGAVELVTRMAPGVALSPEALRTDPRSAYRHGDLGRGPLPPELGRFEGVELAGNTAILHYRVGPTRIREWHEAHLAARRSRLRRHLEIEPHAEAIHLVLGAPAAVQPSRALEIASNVDGVTIVEQDGQHVAVIPPSTTPQRVTFSVVVSNDARSGSAPAALPQTAVVPTPPMPAHPHARWPEVVPAPAEIEVVAENGWLLDRLAVPTPNPWNRRVRPADLAFLNPDRAAVVTYDGDVWLVDGLADEAMARVTWRRFASGLHEPLALAAPGGIIQVATKNGLVRLHDRNGDDEADWFENFSDLMVQSQTTRSFPLDMAIAPDGATFVTQGGIVTQSGIPSGGTGTEHSGAILRISPDGRAITVFAEHAREPFVTVHPVTGLVTGTDQQGHYIPSSVVYLVREGDTYGFLNPDPERISPPLVWLPHDQDSASSSQVWTVGSRMGVWADRLLHLSYGTGRLFLITPDLDAPVPQGAAIPLEITTDLPLLHARMHPDGGAVFLAGFQIYGSRVSTPWALGRLRPGPSPVSTAVAARSVANGVILEFAEPLDPASLQPEAVSVRAWDYRRSAEYGSGRYTPSGASGTVALGVGQVVASKDGRSVFIHLPELPPVMQLEVRHDFRLQSGVAARGAAYFTVHQPAPVELAAVGFPHVDLTQSRPVVAVQEEPPASIASGRELATNLGCAACHSADGSTEGQIGPTWQGLFGATRTFVDGTTAVADEQYIREKILDPLKRRVSLSQAEMPSYRGVVSESQLDSLVLYIKSLQHPPRR